MATPAATPFPSKVDQRLAREAAREAQEATPLPNSAIEIPKKGGAYQKRIDALVRARTEALARTARAERRVAELEARVRQLERLLAEYRNELKRWRSEALRLRKEVSNGGRG